MRVALVVPPYASELRLGESLGIKYLAAGLDAAGLGADVIEASLMGLDEEGTLAQLADQTFDLIGFASTFGMLGSATRIARRLREEGCGAHITLGGHTATAISAQLLRENSAVDSVLRYEADRSIIQLAEAIAGGRAFEDVEGIAWRLPSGAVTEGSPGAVDVDLDSIPLPRRDATSRLNGGPHFMLVSSRGCPFACSFCSISTFYANCNSRWRARSAEGVIDEIVSLKRDYGAEILSFMDDNFIGSSRRGRARALSIAHALRDSGLSWSIMARPDDVDEPSMREFAACGLKHIFLGIESLLPATLAMYRKRGTASSSIEAVKVARAAGVEVDAGLILFHPWVSVEEVADGVALASRAGIASVQNLTSLLEVYPGTPIFDALLAQGRLTAKDYAWSYDFASPDVERLRLSLKRALAPFRRIEDRASQLRFEIGATRSDLLSEVLEIQESLSAQIGEYSARIVSVIRHRTNGDAAKAIDGIMQNIEVAASNGLRRLSDLRGRAGMWPSGDGQTGGE